MTPRLYQPPGRKTCSTLVRAVIDATLPDPIQAPCQNGLAVPSFGPLSMQRRMPVISSAQIDHLQYPRSGRYRCNMVRFPLLSMVMVLQYPRSGRYRCNKVPPGGVVVPLAACSTLVRAVIDATAADDDRHDGRDGLAVPSFGPLSMQPRMVFVSI